LNTNFNPSAPVGQHLIEVRLQTIVRTSFDGDANTAGPDCQLLERN
jgi:hypothetical protein